MDEELQEIIREAHHGDYQAFQALLEYDDSSLFLIEIFKDPEIEKHGVVKVAELCDEIAREFGDNAARAKISSEVRRYLVALNKANPRVAYAPAIWEEVALLLEVEDQLVGSTSWRFDEIGDPEWTYEVEREALWDWLEEKRIDKKEIGEDSLDDARHCIGGAIVDALMPYKHLPSIMQSKVVDRINEFVVDLYEDDPPEKLEDVIKIVYQTKETLILRVTDEYVTMQRYPDILPPEVESLGDLLQLVSPRTTHSDPEIANENLPHLWMIKDILQTTNWIIHEYLRISPDFNITFNQWADWKMPPDEEIFSALGLKEE